MPPGMRHRSRWPVRQQALDQRCGSVLLGLLFVGVAGNFLGVGLGGLGGVVSIGKVGLRLGGGSLGSGDGLAGIGVGLGCRC